MDFLISIDFFAVCIVLAIFIIPLVKEWKRSMAAHRKLPPSPWKLPLIGNLHHFRDSSPPHHILRNLAHKYGPLMHLQLGEISAMVVSSPRLAELVMKTHDLAFANRAQFLSNKIGLYNGSDLAFAPYGEFWRQMRKICILELLSTKTVRSFDSIRNEEVLKLIKSIKVAAAGGTGGAAVPINLREKLCQYTSAMVFRAAFGRVSEEHRTAFLKQLMDSLSFSSILDVRDLFPSLKILHPFLSRKNLMLRIHSKFDQIVERIIDQHRENFYRTKQGMGELGQEDIVDVLLRVQRSGDLQVPITNDHIKGVIMDIFIGSTENPSSIVEWAMSEMIKNPYVMAKAQREIREIFRGKETILEADVQNLKYLKLVIKETLRLHPIVPCLVPRKNIEECEVDGYTIPIGTVVMVNVWAIGRDPNYWEDAEAFKPERFENLSADFTGNNFQYLPFGAGRRICPGISFGLANAELPLALLLYHFDWKLSDGLSSDDLDMSETVGITVMKKNPLQLLATSYDPSAEN